MLVLATLAMLSACAHDRVQESIHCREGGSGARGGAVASIDPQAVSATTALPAELGALLEIVSPARPAFALLGEVHDNPAHHRQRLAWLEALAARGRFALAFEQLDAQRQAAMDAARAVGADARALARAGGFDEGGWDWDSYRPFFELAIRRDLPLVAANLSLAAARDIARGERGGNPGGAGADDSGSTAASRDVRRTVVTPLPQPVWLPGERARIEQQIADGHCGMLPARALAPMADAQIARDASMAAALLRAHASTGLPVVLLAGNGHLRRDIGMPRHFAAQSPRSVVTAIGLLERGDGDAPDEPAVYDRILWTSPHPRPDPCEQFRTRMQRVRPG